jgi:hypothetical protein
MKNLNRFLITLYFIAGLILVLIFIDESTNANVFPMVNHTGENLIFFGLIPAMIVAAVFAYITSYKAIIVKLSIPVLLILISLISMASPNSNGADIVAGITFGVTVLYAIGLVIITSIAKLIAKRRTNSKSITY